MKLVNLARGWSSCGEKLVKLEENWWKVGQVGEKLVKKLVKLVNLVGSWSSWWKVGQVGQFGHIAFWFVNSGWWNCEMGELFKNPWHLKYARYKCPVLGKHHIVCAVQDGQVVPLNITCVNSNSDTCNELFNNFAAFFPWQQLKVI